MDWINPSLALKHQVEGCPMFKGQQKFGSLLHGMPQPLQLKESKGRTIRLKIN